MPLRIFRVTSLVVRRARYRLQRRIPDLPELRGIHATHCVETNGARLVVHEILSDATPEGTHPVTVVFAHGFTLSAQSWFFQAQRLRQEPGLRMLIPDLRGHGASTADRDSLTVENTSRDLLRIIDELAPEGTLILVGHSMGVMTVLGAMRLGTAELRKRVQGIALINGAIDTFASAGITMILRSWPIQAMRFLGKLMPQAAESFKNSIEGVLEPFIATFVYHGALEEGMSARFDIVEFHAEEIDRTNMSTILGFFDDLVEHDETPAAEAIAGVPGVVMVGAKDNVTPASQTREIASLWDGAELREFPEAGHMLPVECPEAVNREIVKLVRSAQSQG